MIDTDGIYDRCQCGERADEQQTSGMVRAVCHSCGAATRWHYSASGSMIEWNQCQRKYKAAIKVAAGENNC